MARALVSCGAYLVKIRAALGAVVLSLLVLIPLPASANEPISGIWLGSYDCQRVRTSLVLELPKGGVNRAYLISSDGGYGEARLKGRIDHEYIRVEPLVWLKQPKGGTSFGFTGHLMEQARLLDGQVSGCFLTVQIAMRQLSGDVSPAALEDAFARASRLLKKSLVTRFAA